MKDIELKWRGYTIDYPNYPEGWIYEKLETENNIYEIREDFRDFKYFHYWVHKKGIKGAYGGVTLTHKEARERTEGAARMEGKSKKLAAIKKMKRELKNES